MNSETYSQIDESNEFEQSSDGILDPPPPSEVLNSILKCFGANSNKILRQYYPLL